ncbi:MAG: hypothetical protein QM811_06560 [Pirellulales bacterium]
MSNPSQPGTPLGVVPQTAVPLTATPLGAAPLAKAVSLNDPLRTPAAVPTPAVPTAETPDDDDRRGIFARMRDWAIYDGPPMLISTIVHSVIFLILALTLGNVYSDPPKPKGHDFTAADYAEMGEPQLERFELGDPELDPGQLDTDLTSMVDGDAGLPDAELDADAPKFEKQSGGSELSSDSYMGGLGMNISASGLGPKLDGGGGLFAGGGGKGGSTIFGKVVRGTGGKGGSGGGGGVGLVGKFYDLKQDRQRKPLPYSGAFPDFIKTLNRLADKGYSDAVMKEYFQADTQLAFSQLLIPATTPAEDAPKAFDVEGQVKPRGWFVHYSGTVIPPKSGEWRFVGFFDDVLIVYVNNQPVLDGSWVPMCNVGKGTYDNALRQEFNGPKISGNRTAYAGKWINLSGPTKIDILVGEVPGGLVGGLLMCQARDQKYAVRRDGTPILPLFVTARPDSRNLRQNLFAQQYGFADYMPIWKTKIAK